MGRSEVGRGRCRDREPGVVAGEVVRGWCREQPGVVAVEVVRGRCRDREPGVVAAEVVRGRCREPGVEAAEVVRGWRRDRGMVTAEAAVVLPVLVAFTMGLLWALLAASAQIRCVDAARAGARAMARQEARGAAIGAAQQAAPRGARVEVSREGDLVRVTVRTRAAGPGPLGVELSAQAVAAAEETVGEA